MKDGLKKMKKWKTRSSTIKKINLNWLFHNSKLFYVCVVLKIYKVSVCILYGLVFLQILFLRICIYASMYDPRTCLNEALQLLLNSELFVLGMYYSNYQSYFLISFRFVNIILFSVAVYKISNCNSSY